MKKMEFKGTKGVWDISERYEFVKNTSTIEIYAEEFWICQVNAISECRKIEIEANAKLIAAAPEMFELLKEILFYGLNRSTEEKANELLTKITQ